MKNKNYNFRKNVKPLIPWNPDWETNPGTEAEFEYHEQFGKHENPYCITQSPAAWKRHEMEWELRDER